MRLILLVASAALLSACASNTWTKKGVSEEEMKQDRTACEQEALKAIPPKIVTVGGKMSPSRTQCDPKMGGTGSEQRCYTVPGNYIPETQVDENQSARADAIGSCLQRRGWTKG